MPFAMRRIPSKPGSAACEALRLASGTKVVGEHALTAHKKIMACGKAIAFAFAAAAAEGCLLPHEPDAAHAGVVALAALFGLDILKTAHSLILNVEGNELYAKKKKEEAEKNWVYNGDVARAMGSAVGSILTEAAEGSTGEEWAAIATIGKKAGDLWHKVAAEDR